MYATHPTMAARWEAHTPKDKKLPKHVKKKAADLSSLTASLVLGTYCPGAEKLASDLGVSTDLVHALARSEGVALDVFVKWAYENPDTFLSYLQTVKEADMDPGTQQAAPQGGVPGAHEAIKSMAAPQEQAHGDMPRPSPSGGKPPHSDGSPQPPHGVGHAPSGSHTEPHGGGHHNVQALAHMLDQILAKHHGGGLHHQEAPTEHTSPKAASDMFGRNVIRVAVRNHLQQVKQAEARQTMLSYLDTVAAKLPVEKQAATRTIQACLTRGQTLGTAIKQACPHLTPEARGILAKQLANGATKYACSMTQEYSTTAKPDKAVGRMKEMVGH